MKQEHRANNCCIAVTWLNRAGADPAFGQGGGCKNNVAPTFAAAIANVSDHVHAPKTSYRNQHESAVVDSDCTSWTPEGAYTSHRGLGRSPGSQADTRANMRSLIRISVGVVTRDM